MYSVYRACLHVKYTHLVYNIVNTHLVYNGVVCTFSTHILQAIQL